jgi:hypothetical protein
MQYYPNVAFDLVTYLSIYLKRSKILIRRFSFKDRSECERRGLEMNTTCLLNKKSVM